MWRRIKGDEREVEEVVAAAASMGTARAARMVWNCMVTECGVLKRDWMVGGGEAGADVSWAGGQERADQVVVGASEGFL